MIARKDDGNHLIRREEFLSFANLRHRYAAQGGGGGVLQLKSQGGLEKVLGTQTDGKYAKR